MTEKEKPHIPDTVFSALDAHWKRIGEALEDADRNRGRRQAFLRSWLRAGMNAGGPAWAHLPFMMRNAAKQAHGPRNNPSDLMAGTES
jgi:hypothetical protein